MPYLLGGKDIRTLVETETTSGPRNPTELGNSKYLFNGKTHQIQYGEKIIADYDGYIYSGDAGLKSKFLRAGSSYFTVAKKGNRPCPTYPRRRWESSSVGTYYVNKFSDGEVWVSTTFNSRTGTRISTTAANINYIFVMLIGPGGGGGGGNGTKSGGGGGGGSFAYLCHRLVAGWVHRIAIYPGGDAGARNTNGGGGNASQFAVFTDINNLGNTGVSTVNVLGGGGGRSGGNDGVGGTGGQVSSSSSNVYIKRLDERTGTIGGSRGGNAGGSTSAYNTQAYTPENHRLEYGKGAGGQPDGGSGSGGGGGWFYGHNGGNATSGGAGKDGGIGAGGGSGAWVIFAGHPGGKGGNGYAAIFY
ncbi:MAG: hypothetical protein ACOX24_00405 [Christensenellales bacterium]|jgi:hypothetical protein